MTCALDACFASVLHYYICAPQTQFSTRFELAYTFGAKVYTFFSATIRGKFLFHLFLEVFFVKVVPLALFHFFQNL